MAGERLELPITGMTCASCANRIERKLNKLDGVTATVNYATEKALVSFPADVTPDALVDTVKQADEHDDSVGFAATFPTQGRYRLYLQFKHEARVHTVAFTQEVR